MCRRVSCKRCGKASWAGCGAHVDQVLAGVPAAERCRCREAASTDPAPKTDAGGAAKSWLDKLLGR